MKKSKIIVPALAMIGLSAVASVTGSVAWFTAQRTGSILTNNFAVVKTDGTLAVSTGAGIGTETVSGQGNEGKINCVSGAKLANASFNPLTRQLYTATAAAASGVASSFTRVGDTNSYNTAVAQDGSHPFILSNTENAKFYYAFTWDVTVSYTWESDVRDINVFFDYSRSSMNPQNAAGSEDVTGANVKTAKALRIGILNDAAAPTHTVIYSGIESTEQFIATNGLNGSDKSVYDVLGTSAASTTHSYFGSDNFGFINTTADDESVIASDYNYATDGSSGQTAREDFLVTLNHTNKTSATFKCIAWYEGNDENILSQNDVQSVVSTIGFYSAVAA